MTLHIDIPLTPMESDMVSTLLNRSPYKTNSAHVTIGSAIDMAMLSTNAKAALDDGDILPELLYYWAKVAAEVQAFSEANNMYACWYSIKNRQAYELSTYTLAELLCNTFLWENDTLDLALVWCDMNEFNIFNPDMNFDGFIIPLDSGLGLVSSLSEASYKHLANYLK